MGSLAWRRLVMALCTLAALPAADFTTYIGDTNDYRVARAIADAAGNTYVAGSRLSGAFAMKLDGAGKIVLFATVSGKGVDQANDLAVDAAGNIYLAGATSSALLPLRSPLQATPGPGFLVKFNPDATQVLYATYFPAPIAALAIDGAGNMYVTGVTNAPAFPVTPGLPAGTVTPPTSITSASGAFLTKISAAGDRIVYSTLLVGHQKNCGAGSSCFLSARITAGVAVAVDAAGNAYLAGNTDTTDIPATSGALLTAGVGAFVGKVNAAGSALVYLTYLGGYIVQAPFASATHMVTGIAADAAGNAYVTGSIHELVAGGTHALVTKINPLGSAAVWSTTIGGTESDTGHAIALDSAGNVWINGTTSSPDFPNGQAWSQGSDFVVEVDAAGASLPYSSRFPNDTAAASLAIDPAGALHFGGGSGLVSTLSPALPVAPRVFGIANAAFGPAGGQIVPGELISIYGPHIGPATPLTAVADAAGFLPTSLGGMQVTINGTPIPLLYVSDSQVNAVTPLYLSGSAQVRVGVAATFTAAVVASAPEIFQVAINSDGTVNSETHPAKAGSIVSIWATGTGAPPFDATMQDGRIASVARDFECCQVYGFQPLPVFYAGSAPGTVNGVVQINFQAPAFTGLVSLTALGKSSIGMEIWVAP